VARDEMPMICQDCGVEAKTKFVSFHQNIGLLIMRLPKTVEGHLCKSCINKHFWEMTGITAVAGWWGVISFIVTPFFLLNNIVRYLGCLSMPPVEPGASRPRMTKEAWSNIKGHTEEIIYLLNKGKDLDTVATEIAEKANVSPGQVILFIQELARSQAQD
jgi:hypothetical protein